MRRALFSQIVFLLILATLPSARASFTTAERCSIHETLKHLFSIETARGTQIPSRKIRDLLPYSKLEFFAEELGTGKGGTVYRIIPKHHPEKAFIAKVTDTDTAIHDSIGFDLLRQAATPESEIKIARSKILPTKDQSHQFTPMAVMQVDNVEGRSLSSILADPKTPRLVTETLNNHYKNFLKRIQRYFDEEFGIEAKLIDPHPKYFQAEKNLGEKAIQAQPKILILSISPDQLFGPFSKHNDLLKKLNALTHRRADLIVHTSKEIEIMIKSDNIIVTPDYDLYLIDPQ